MGRRIQFRRGPEATRLQTVLGNGEPGFSTDTKQLYVGDGETLGGVPVLMGFYQVVENDMGAVAGGTYLFATACTLHLPQTAPEGSHITVKLLSNAGASKASPAKVCPPSGQSIGRGEEAGFEYHMTIPNTQRDFIFVQGGWILA
ncbi:hyaluronate lyase N-terminal domain-containing protein [Pseudoalteromonas maricaloris]